jgi:dihydrofolate reductase
MGRADRLEITQIHARPAGDTRFPDIDLSVWHEIARQTHPAGEGDDAACDFVTYRRQKPDKTPG